jgi:hypothetical protein
VSQLLLPVLLGFLLLAILLYWSLTGTTSSNREIGLSDAREALNRLQLQILPAGLVDRILNPDDFEFVRNERNPAILRMLEMERKTIAISWLRQTRHQVGLLMRSHVRAARSNAKLNPVIETKLAVDFFIFLLTYKVLLGLIWVSGPFQARKVASSVIHAVTRICQTSERFLPHPAVRGSSVPAVPGSGASGLR